MEISSLDRLYEQASLAAASLEAELIWLEAEDTSVSDVGQCRNEFTIRLTSDGATREQQIESLIDELQACLTVLERLASSGSCSSQRLAPSARRRGGADLRKFG